MIWVTEQWGRVVWAFGHEGAAFVQGLSALVAAVATVVLVRITSRYARLTEEMVKVSAEMAKQTAEMAKTSTDAAQTAASQLVASLYPTLEFEFKKVDAGGQVDIRLRNTGDVAAKLVHCEFGGKVHTVGLGTAFGEIHLKPVELKALENTILGEGQETLVRVTIAFLNVPEEQWGAILLHPREYVLRVNCTDPRGVTKHSFVRRTDRRVEYYPYFTSSEQELSD